MHFAISAVDGLLDTNVVIHALASDAHSDECRRFISQLAAGTIQAWLEPMMLHEISYVLPRYLKQLTRREIAQSLITVLSWTGVRGDIDAMRRAVNLWSEHTSLAFVDAYLAAVALEERLPVFTKNTGELKSLGIPVPDPLPGLG